MTERTPDPECPGCLGKGEEKFDYSWQTHEQKSLGIGPCRFCYPLWETIRKEADEMANRYSGKFSRELSPEDQEERFTGEDGQLYRRLLSWLWAHHPRSNQMEWQGFDSKHKTKPFRKLFSFERKPKARKRWPAIITVPEQTPAQPIFAVGGAEFKAAWNEAIKPIDRSCRIPVLHYVKVSVTLDRVRLQATDLDVWAEIEIPCCGFREGEYLLHGRKVAEILRTCSKADTLALGLPVDRRHPGFLLMANDTTVWKLVTLEPENFPNRKREEPDEQVA